MEDQAIYSAALASSTEAVPTMRIILVAGLVLYVVLVAAVIRELHKWGRYMEKRAARLERQHQEYMISSELDARRRRVELARLMRGLNARRRW